MRSYRTGSLRRGLIVRLLLVLGAMWILSTGYALWRTWHEVGEAYEDQVLHLAQAVAQSYVDIDAGIRDEAITPPPRGSLRNYFVVVEDGGELLYRSRQAPRDVADIGGRWKAAKIEVSESGLTVVAGIAFEEPLQLAIGVASGVALPMLGGFVFITLGVIFSVGRELQPLERMRADLRSREPRRLDPVCLDDLPDEVRLLAESLNALFLRVSSTLDHERRFIADASHELRTPLTALKAHIQNIDENRLDPEIRQSLEKISEGVERSTRLVQQLLTLARADIRQPLCATPVALDVVMRDAVSDLFPETVKAGGDLWFEGRAAFVRADPFDVQIVLRNLIENSLRHGRSPIRVSCGQDGDRAVFAVEDCGNGIAEIDRSAVFAAFHRGPQAYGPGSGLGLSIVKSMVERWGAEVQLGQSSDLKGLKVAISFPPIAT